MIKIQCPRCKETFEIPDSLAGQHETCPKCDYSIPIPGKASTVPVEQTNSPNRSIWNKDIFGVTGNTKTDYKPPSAESNNLPPLLGSMWRLFSYGWLMTLSGISIMTLASGMDVSVYARGLGSVANLDKMNQRSDWIMIGLGLFISGVLTLGMSAIQRTIIRSGNQRFVEHIQLISAAKT